MSKKNIFIFPGDEIGPEITTEAIKIIDFLNESKMTDIHYEFGDVGGASLDKYNKPITDGDILAISNSQGSLTSRTTISCSLIFIFKSSTLIIFIT